MRRATDLNPWVGLGLLILTIYGTFVLGQSPAPATLGPGPGEAKVILCLGQPQPCSELGRTRLLVIYAKAALAQQSAMAAQVELQKSANEFNQAVRDLARVEGLPEGTSYQPDIQNNFLKVVPPPGSASTTPTTPPSSTSPPVLPPTKEPKK
jgi:hypothetical protein